MNFATAAGGGYNGVPSRIQFLRYFGLHTMQAAANAVKAFGIIARKLSRSTEFPTAQKIRTGAASSAGYFVAAASPQKNPNTAKWVSSVASRPIRTAARINVA